MNGKDLYQFWVEANESEDVGVEPWEDLSYDDQVVWDKTARALGPSLADTP